MNGNDSSWATTWRDIIIPLLAPRSRSVKVIMRKGPHNARPQNITTSLDEDPTATARMRATAP